MNTIETSMSLINREEMSKKIKMDIFDIQESAKNISQNDISPDTEVENEKLGLGDFYQMLFQHKEIGREDGKFVVLQKDEEDNQIKQEFQKQLDEIRYIELGNGVYLIKDKNQTTLYFDKNSQDADIEEINKQLKELNVKPNKVLGANEEQIKYLQEQKYQMEVLKTVSQNSKNSKFFKLGLAVIAGALLIHNKERIKKLLKNRRMKKAMYPEHKPEEDNEEEEEYKNLFDYEKFYMKKNEDERLRLFKEYIYKHIDYLEMPKEEINEIKERVEREKYDDIIENSLAPQNALANVILKNMDIDSEVQVFLREEVKQDFEKDLAFQKK